MKIQEVLATPDKWCKYDNAVTKLGCDVLPDSSQAVKWCLVGAAMKCYSGLELTRVRNLIATKILPFTYITSYNDAAERTFEDIRRLIEELDV